MDGGMGTLAVVRRGRGLVMTGTRGGVGVVLWLVGEKREKKEGIKGAMVVDGGVWMDRRGRQQRKTAERWVRSAGRGLAFACARKSRRWGVEKG